MKRLRKGNLENQFICHTLSCALSKPLVVVGGVCGATPPPPPVRSNSAWQLHYFAAVYRTDIINRVRHTCSLRESFATQCSRL